MLFLFDAMNMFAAVSPSFLSSMAHAMYKANKRPSIIEQFVTAE